MSGKTADGATDNQKARRKSSLVPRNHAGMIVVSQTAETVASVLKLIYDPVLDDYGLAGWLVSDGVHTWYEPVVDAFDDPTTGIDCRQVPLPGPAVTARP